MVTSVILVYKDFLKYYLHYKFSHPMQSKSGFFKLPCSTICRYLSVNKWVYLNGIKRTANR